MNQYKILVKETRARSAQVRAESPERAIESLREHIEEAGIDDFDNPGVPADYAFGAVEPVDPALWPAHVVEAYEDEGPILPPRAERPEFWAESGGHWWACNGHVAIREGETPPTDATQGWIIWAKEDGATPAKIPEWIANATRVLHFTEPKHSHYEPFLINHVESAKHDGDEIVALNARNWAPWAQCDWFGRGLYEPCVAKRNGEAVAIVMPMRGDRSVRTMLADWARTGDASEAQRLLSRLTNAFPMEVDGHSLAWLVRKALEPKPEPAALGAALGGSRG